MTPRFEIDKLSEYRLEQIGGHAWNRGQSVCPSTPPVLCCQEKSRRILGRFRPTNWPISCPQTAAIAPKADLAELRRRV